MGKIKENSIFFNVEDIINTVCNFYGINKKVLIDRTKKHYAVEPRQMCFYLLKKHTDLTLEKIGLELGGYSHSNVMYAIKTIQNISDTDKTFSNKVKDIESCYLKNQKPRVYIAGKITGLPRKDVVENFSKAQKLLEKYGFNVLNPTVFVEPHTDWNEAMRIGIIYLMTCSHIFLLPDWYESKGATIEYEISKLMNIKHITQLELCKKLS